MPSASSGKANVIFAAISNPDRRGMLDLLRDGDHSAGELVAAFPDLPQPAVSRHLRVLREAGLVQASQVSQKRIYSLQPGKLREVEAWVSLYRGFWSGRLDSLSEHLGGTTRRRSAS